MSNSSNVLSSSFLVIGLHSRTLVLAHSCLSSASSSTTSTRGCTTSQSSTTSLAKLALRFPASLLFAGLALTSWLLLVADAGCLGKFLALHQGLGDVAVFDDSRVGEDSASPESCG